MVFHPADIAYLDVGQICQCDSTILPADISRPCRSSVEFFVDGDLGAVDQDTSSDPLFSTGSHLLSPVHILCGSVLRSLTVSLRGYMYLTPHMQRTAQRASSSQKPPLLHGTFMSLKGIVRIYNSIRKVITRIK